MDYPMLIGFAVVVWAVVELIQRLRKRPARSAIKAGAVWAAVMVTFAIYGQVPEEMVSWTGLSLVAGVCGVLIAGIYWLRVSLFKPAEASS